MASFDKSYYDILNKYDSIREQRYQVVDTQTGQVIGVTDQKPPTQPASAQPTGDPAAAQATGVPAGTTPAQFDARRAAQTGVSRPTTAPDQIAAVPADAEPSEEQKKNFQRLHGSPYNPQSSMDKSKMQMQKQAEATSGGDFNKLRQTVYAGNNANPLNTGKPGQPTGGNNMLIGGQGNTPARQVNLNTGQSTEVPRATPVFKPDPSVTAAKATGVPVGTTPAEFDARRAAQTGTTRPASPAATTSSPAKPASPTTTTKK